MPEEVDLFEKRPKTASVVSTCGSADDRFQLVAKLISTPEAIEGVAREYLDLEEMIRGQFLRLIGEIGIPGESRLFNELLLLLKDLRDLVEFPHLANKNVLAIGGGFSSGKSRFINALLGGGKLLPEGINPTTAIPTFLTCGDSEVIRSLNTFNRSERLSRKDFQAISHAFNEGDISPQSNVSFYHILKLVQIQTPLFKWKNIALLDTPGYSAPQGVDETVAAGAGNTDKEKAREHLSQADHLIWAVKATDGTLQQDDIEFLRDEVQWSKPVYLLITKCDQSTDKDLAAQMSCIREEFGAHFKMAGWSAFSAKRNKVLAGDDPRKWFDEIDGKIKFTRWRGRFQSIIDQVIRFNAEEANRCSALEKSLAPVFVNGDDILTDCQVETIKRAMDAIKNERKARSQATQQFIDFRSKLELQLGTILKSLNISDETASAVGLTAKLKYSRQVCNLKSGDILRGVVVMYSKFNGCYLKVDGFDDVEQATIRKADMNKYYSAPEKTFVVGTKVKLSVYEVQHKAKQIIFTVTVE